MTIACHLGNIGRAARRFTKDTTGSTTVMSLFSFITLAGVSALAIDVSHVYNKRIELQIAADMAAHAALYNREGMTADDAKAEALALVRHSLPPEHAGHLLTADTIGFGRWEDGEFVYDEDANSAVMVQTSRTADLGNPVYSFLAQWIGQDAWDVRANSTFVTYRPMCFREGFVAEGVVDIQSNNAYFNGFCLHSNEYVSLNSNNTFEPGTIVSMPDTADLDMPNSGFDTNEGLEEALRSGAYRLRILNDIDEIFDGLRTYGSEYTPDYITSYEVLSLYDRRPTTDDFVEGHITLHSCPGTKATIQAGSTNALRNVVIVSDCEIKFENGLELQNVVVATTSTSATSFNSSSGLKVGLDDDCAEGGGAQLLTYGGMNFASGLHMYGGQLIALKDIEFAANANGIQGASMVAGGMIDGTSNMNMGFCGSGMEDNFEVDYYRLAI
ncbi:hypothetical protein JQU17_13495 [Ponticoccus sp. SC2-23]|uniref:pilus assembly protein TadG-related protein n=1 Tax=Alexandriicola marinus TaxID=2081710 RepID=UPI000FD98279|nr:pilus assembly protein TadG-related protein [Alexandriicola marinus]MBM1221243.1 hypothetical protein [Ponticoccus sp. SC6-9]MBM1225813.1 hypothetical protein [Ponticoccus sp. SC6-15]MBM1227965.1 hypothetical protein [Ponticoccus sp. SC6-38]MBM1234397.1 hypothetical protein [Ponticoccus sp. SC6-45]MBM1238467.1 hypothetical protein [Ponticoccus sp. SC6-49]MBM1243736.1 hypothetical protein [Ponticoccus sp. SC2-64]MBM1247921.1 hypothetical protein [Ponticoccus sp. SC6-42]MBM1252867.1 hypoth